MEATSGSHRQMDREQNLDSSTKKCSTKLARLLGSREPKWRVRGRLDSKMSGLGVLRLEGGYSGGGQPRRGHKNEQTMEAKARWAGARTTIIALSLSNTKVHVGRKLVRLARLTRRENKNNGRHKCRSFQSQP